MSNWDLMMPGMGLTAIGLAGVTISYAGIAHTFIDGMHALTGLTMFLGLIFLAAGILEGGVSTSNRAKATTLVVLGISFSFGLAALNFNAITTIPTFAGVMLIVAVPAIVMAYVSMKMPQYFKPVSAIFVIAVGAAIIAYVGFGVYGPSPYLLVTSEEIEEPLEGEPVSAAPVFSISILEGSDVEGNPDYDPDVATVPFGDIIEWTNNDDVAHTVTSAADAGETFDSGLMSAGDTYRLDTSTLSPGTYEYICIVHPWMTASFVLEEGAEAAPEFPISILEGSSIEGNPDYDPDFAQVPFGDTIIWTNNDSTMHTVTSTAAEPVFDSSVIAAGDTFRLDTNTLELGTYEYFCLVHPWMIASFELVSEGEGTADAATVSEPSPPPEPQTPVEEAPAEEPEEGPADTTPETQETTDTTVSIPQGSSSIGCEETDECFIPNTITVSAGTTVTWTNDDSAAHTVTSGQDASPDGFFDSGLFMAGKTFSHTFEEPGEYEYFCFVHLWMKGTVIVE